MRGNATERVGKLLLQAESSLPFAFISLEVTAPAELSFSQKEINFSNVPSSSTVSGLSINTYFPETFFNAMLFAFEKPRFLSLGINFTSGYLLLINTTLSSTELLSTT